MTDNIANLNPRGDAANIQEAAQRIAEGLRKGAGDREARMRETAEIASKVEARFDAYDAALAAARRARETAEDRVREMEARVEATRSEAEHSLAEAAGRHGAEMAEAAEAHRRELAEADEAHRQDIERLREGLDRLKEDMGRRFMCLEEENAQAREEIERQAEENASLTRSIRLLIEAVESSARSMQSDDNVLATAMSGVRERAADVEVSNVVVRLPQRQRGQGDAAASDASGTVAAQARTAG